jgi:predicted DNA binding CopG/RHH family protein
MKKRTRYTDDESGGLQVVKDFLPNPDQLVLRDEKIKITISLSKTSVTFFKHMARKHRTQYQKMIRNLLDHYAARHTPRPSRNSVRPGVRRPGP